MDIRVVLRCMGRLLVEWWVSDEMMDLWEAIMDNELGNRMSTTQHCNYKKFLLFSFNEIFIDLTIKQNLFLPKFRLDIY